MKRPESLSLLPSTDHYAAFGKNLNNKKKNLRQAVLFLCKIKLHLIDKLSRNLEAESTEWSTGFSLTTQAWNKRLKWAHPGQMNHRVIRKPIDCYILLQCLLRVCFYTIQSISLSAQTVPFALMLEHSAHIPPWQQPWEAETLRREINQEKYKSLDFGKRGKELANQLLCQHLNLSKHFWWKDFGKVCYFVKAVCLSKHNVWQSLEQEGHRHTV